MNSEALAIQSQPARPDRVADAGGNHDARVVVSRIGDAVDDLEFSARTGANCCADCYRERTDDFSAFEHRQLAAQDFRTARVARQVLVSIPDRKLAALEGGKDMRTFPVTVRRTVSSSPSGQ